MKTILLGLKDYENHTSDEGHQLQQGLAEQGVQLWGKGFENDCTDVEEILRRTRPDVAIVIDKREWDPDSKGAYDKRAAFTGIGHLRLADNVCRITICKDAGTRPQDQRDWMGDVGPHGYITYYHEDAVDRVAPWIGPERMIRTYHSLDSERVPEFRTYRCKALVSGARNPAVYTLRETCFRHRDSLGITLMRHPGYGNCGTCTPHFLDALGTWKVHVCCASRFGFALRKIMESVACGATVITDLPAYDVLPEIDEALVRVPSEIPADEMKKIIRREVDGWDKDRAMYFAEKAKAFYDWRAVGRRLYQKIEAFYRRWKESQEFRAERLKAIGA